MPHLLTDIEFDELEWLSTVDAGASGDEDNRPSIQLIKRKKQAAGDHAAQVKIPIVKLDKPQRVIYGLGSIVTGKDGRAIVDHDGDVILAEDLEKAVHKASSMGGTGKGGDMHTFQSACDIVESAVITQEKRAAFEGFLGDSKAEGWMVGLKVNDDETWAKVLSGERPELSIKIRARRTPIETEKPGAVDKLKSLFGLGDKQTQEKQMAENENEDGGQSASAEEQGRAALKATFDATIAELREEQQKVILAWVQMAAEAPTSETEDDNPDDGSEEENEDMEAEKKKESVELTKAREANEELTKRVKSLEDTAELSTCIAKARAEMPNVPGMTVEETGAMLKDAKGSMSAAAFAQLEKSLRATSEAIEKGDLFVEHGTSSHIGLDDDEAALEEAITKMRDEAKESGKPLDYIKAKRQVFREMPALYERIRAKQQ